jgi:hypothetical protein
MKKKKLNHRGLRLNKNTVSSLESENVKGGTVASLFMDKGGNCYASVTTCPHETQLVATCGCPPPPTQQGQTCNDFCTMYFC